MAPSKLSFPLANGALDFHDGGERLRIDLASCTANALAKSLLKGFAIEGGGDIHTAAILPGAFGGERAEPLLKPATAVSHPAKSTVNRNAKMPKGCRPRFDANPFGVVAAQFEAETLPRKELRCWI